jgi:shikimate dehydrogenase
MNSKPYAEVIGDPIAHSKSPLIHNFWLGKLGIYAEYRACRVRPEELADYFAQRRSDPDWRGCNVTMPHKGEVMHNVDDADEIGIAIGAMNTVFRDSSGYLVGTNTDPAGFYEPISRLELLDATVVIIGAGGAARAVLHALKGHGIGYLQILNRSIEKSQALLREAGASYQAIPFDSPLPVADLLVNSSALGMKGYPALSLDLSNLPPTAVIYDLVYAPLETELLKQARSRGLTTINGLAMLIGQAAIAFEKFFGQPAPREYDAELRALLTA